MVIAVSICLVIVLLLIGVLALTDPIMGMVKFNEVKDGAENCSEIVVSDPLREEAFLRGVEAVVTGEQARELADGFAIAVQGASYKKAIDASKGFWDIRLDFSTAAQRYSVYLKEDAVYVAKNKGYLFEIDTDRQDAYAEFFATVEKILDAVE